MENYILDDLYKIHAHTLGIETDFIPFYYMTTISRKNIKRFIEIFCRMYPNITDIEIRSNYVGNTFFAFSFRIKQ